MFKIKQWFFDAGLYSNQLDRAYWKFRIWWQNEVTERWSSLKFNGRQRLKSTWYSIKVGSWHKPCIECWGSGISVKYRQEQECRMGCGVGYQRVDFWHDMFQVLYPSQYIYNLRDSFRRVVRGCNNRNSNIYHEYCRYGTCGCKTHPLINDWAGKPLDKLQ